LPIQELGFGRSNTAYAYDRNEISNVFDKAPAGKKSRRWPSIWALTPKGRK